MPKKKENGGVLESGKQHALKTLSKILQVFSIIARVCLVIGIIFTLITAIALPFIMKDVTINQDEISFKSHKIELRETDNDKIDIYYKDSKIGDLENTEKEVILNLLDKYDAKIVTAVAETALMAAIILMILSFIILGFVVTLMKNINEKDTPFTEENTSLIRKMGFYMIAMFVASMICSGIISFVAIGNIDLSFDFVDLGEILLVFVMSYVFEYGCKLQEKTEDKIYD